LAEFGYDTVASDLSPVAAHRTCAEALARDLRLPIVAADMRGMQPATTRFFQPVPTARKA
jgi:hypothetical protein